MNRIYIIAALVAITAATTAISATTFAPKEALTAAKLNTAFSEKATLGHSARFSTISANVIVVPQQLDEQSITLFEAAEYGNNSITIKPLANMSSNRIITIGNHGLYVDGVQKLEW
jgi:phage major head subunit gpT-like protein